MTLEEPGRRTADGSWMVWTTVGLAAIWLAVLLISLFAPDLVSGSQHEHLPLAAFGTWLWGVVATIGLLWGQGRLRGDALRRPLWTGLSVTVVVIWAVATALSLTLPVFRTGSDPTELPLGALVAPMGAAALTVLAAVVTGVFSRGPGTG
jgi:hypothetical protein